MKLAFICAALEPGRDGVADYTRRLAEECTALGHECRIFALHDPFLTAGVTHASTADGHQRWSAGEPWARRAGALRRELQQFGPDWVSWQFVSYAFHPKGVTPRGLIALARQLGGYHSHVMLHELWIGLERGSGLWSRVIGWRQRRALLKFLAALSPAQVHVSNPAYAAVLARHGYAASLLPLFGNIPLAAVTAQTRAELLARYAPDLPADRCQLAVTFGTLHPQWQPEPTGRWLHLQAARAGRHAVLIAIGRTGPHALPLLVRLSRTGVKVSVTNEISPAEVSALLQTADCGIALHPFALAGKSGAVAAMLDHGLPVVFPRDDWQLRDGPSTATTDHLPGVRLAELETADAGTWPLPRSAPREEFAAAVAAQFAASLRLRLLFYVPQMAPYGGMERHVCSLAAAAARRGHRVTLLTTSNSLGPDLRAELAHPLLEFRELPVARSRAGKVDKLLWLAREAMRARRGAWDIIYTNGQGALARLVWLAARGRTRRIHHHHTAADAGEQATWSVGFRDLLRRTPEIVACSVATRDAIEAAVAPRSNIHLPYLTRCPVAPGDVHERAVEGRLHFGFFGRLIPEKGIDAICRLSTNPALAGITWHLHGAGPDYPPEYFSSYHRVVYHGAYTGGEAHTHALLGLDAVALLSTHNEGMPLSLIEAMAAGLPWVATDRGGTRELALSPRDCVVVPFPATDGMLATAVAELARRIRAGETSRRAQRRAYDRHFSPAVASQRWLGFLEAPRAARSA